MPLRRVAIEYGGPAAVLVAMVVVFGLGTEHFFSAATFRTTLNQIPAALVLATGMTFVLIAGGIDLSVGSVLALGGAVLGIAAQHYGWPMPLAVLACLAVAFAAGALNGFVTTRWSLPAFIVTLGTLEAARGLAYLVTGSRTIYLGASIEGMGASHVLGFSTPLIVALAIVFAAQCVLSGTVFGRHVFAVGANEEAARLSGIDTLRVRRAVYCISGLLAGAAAPMHCARLAAADPNAGIGYELNAIAAAVIGGTSLLGGSGSAIKTLLGVLVIAVLGAGLDHAGLGEPAKRLVSGGVIVGAVVIDHYRRRVVG